jgi:hypothetical protein
MPPITRRLVTAFAFLAGCTRESEKPAANPEPVKGAAIAPRVEAAARLKAIEAPKSAKKGTGVGAGRVAVDASASLDDDPVWVEQIDIAGGGSIKEAKVMLDHQTHTAYAYSAASIQCKNGSIVDGSELMAVYGEGNTFKQPPGSGWYATELDKGQCGADQPSVWGVRFDVDGKVTEEGVATLDHQSRVLVIVSARPASPGGPSVP